MVHSSVSSPNPLIDGAFQIKEKLAWAQRDFGSDSIFFKNLFKATFSSNTLVAFDIKDIISCLLEEPEYVLWEGAWKGSLKGISTELLQASIGTLDTFGKVITVDPLSGEGEWAETKDQMRALSKGLLDKIRTAAK